MNINAELAKILLTKASLLQRISRDILLSGCSFYWPITVINLFSGNLFHARNLDFGLFMG